MNDRKITGLNLRRIFPGEAGFKRASTMERMPMTIKPEFPFMLFRLRINISQLRPFTFFLAFVPTPEPRARPAVGTDWQLNPRTPDKSLGRRRCVETGAFTRSASAYSMKTTRCTLSGIARSPLIFGVNRAANDGVLKPYPHAE